MAPQPQPLRSDVVQAVSVSAAGGRRLPSGSAGGGLSNRVQSIRDHFRLRFPLDPQAAKLMALPIRPSSAYE